MLLSEEVDGYGSGAVSLHELSALTHELLALFLEVDALWFHVLASVGELGSDLGFDVAAEGGVDLDAALVRDRRHEETRYRLQLVGLADGVDYFGIDTDNQNVPRVISEDFSLQMKFYDQGYQLQFWPDEPMKRGKTYDLRYVIRNPSRSEDAVLTAEHVAFHEPTRFASFSVSFIGETPKMMWRVDRLTSIATPGEPTRETILQLNTQQATRTEFSDLYGGLHSGIAWDW